MQIFSPERTKSVALGAAQCISLSIGLSPEGAASLISNTFFVNLNLSSFGLNILPFQGFSNSLCYLHWASPNAFDKTLSGQNNPLIHVFLLFITCCVFRKQKKKPVIQSLDVR